MCIKADLHIHTNSSDGKFNSKDIVNLALNEKINVIAITDHDTTSAVGDALLEGKKLGIKVIPGIELSTTFNGEKIHILSYFKDNTYLDSKFQNFFKELSDFRIHRAKKICDNLKQHFNIKIDYNKLLRECTGVIARPHIAKAIIENGYDFSWNYIFDNFIGENCPAYVANKKVSLEEGLKVLRLTNSLTVLAHPILIKNSKVHDLLKYDFDGIEAIYPLNTDLDTDKFTKLAHKYNKLITAGSDFHGISKKDNSHGSKIGCVSLSGEDLQKFLFNLNI